MSNLERSPSPHSIFPLTESIRQQVTEQMELLESQGIDVAVLERTRLEPELIALINERTDPLNTIATSSYSIGAAYLHMVLRGHCNPLPQLPVGAHKMALANSRMTHIDNDTQLQQQDRMKRLIDADPALQWVVDYGEARTYESAQVGFISKKECSMAYFWFREAVFDTYELYDNYYKNRALPDAWYE